jgi:hypothetical protein
MQIRIASKLSAEKSPEMSEFKSGGRSGKVDRADAFEKRRNCQAREPAMRESELRFAVVYL